MTARRIAVVGSGLSGLLAAHALRQAGHDITAVGRLATSYVQAVDVRLQSHRWMTDLAAAGGRIAIEKLDIARLDAIAAAHDLVLVGSGRGMLAELFPRNAGRSVYSAPQRKVAMAIVTGAPQASDGAPFLAVKIHIIERHGEAFFIPPG